MDPLGAVWPLASPIPPSSASMWCNRFFKPGSLSARAIKCNPWIYDTNCCNFGTPPPSVATLGMIEGSTPFYSQLHFWRGMIEAPFYGQLHSDFFLCIPSQQPPRTLSWVEVFVWWGSHASPNRCNIRNIKVEHETLYCHLHSRSLHSSLSIHLDLSNPKYTYNSHLQGSPRPTLHPKNPFIYS